MATSAEKAAHRNVIKFCVDLGMTPIETQKQMKLTDDHRKVSRALVYKWHKRFIDGWSPEAEIITGRPKEFDAATIADVRRVIDLDRRKTVRDVSEIVGLSKTSVHRILSEDLRMSKVCARWVPRLLTDVEKIKRVKASKEFLRHHKRDNQFLNKIITVDETWLHYYDPEDKRQSSVWKTVESPPPKKAKVVKSAGKHMFIVFIDSRGVILCHAVPQGQTVNAAYYSKVIRRDLLRAIRKKRPHMVDDLENVWFHQDNAPCHTAERTQLDLNVLGFRSFTHPPYSPDLAPLDFAFFPLLKSHLRGRRFISFEELRQVTLNIIQRMEKPWFKTVFEKWVQRHQKCIRHNGEYFEKE